MCGALEAQLGRASGDGSLDAAAAVPLTGGALLFARRGPVVDQPLRIDAQERSAIRRKLDAPHRAPSPYHQLELVENQGALDPPQGANRRTDNDEDGPLDVREIAWVQAEAGCELHPGRIDLPGVDRAPGVRQDRGQRSDEVTSC